jgi:hypothetical protein
MAGLHEHHDHACSRYETGVARFPPTILCDQCNSADGAAKRRLSLPESFSFSPAQIAEFVTATPHGKHKINFDLAKHLYDSL